MGKFIADLIDELLQGVAKDFPAFLDNKLLPLIRDFTPYFKIILVKIVLVAAAVEAFTVMLLRLFLENAENIVIFIATRFVSNDPHLRQAVVEMTHSLLQALRIHYFVYGSILFTSIILGITSTGFPLLYKLLSKPKLMVFISFNRTREDIAKTLQQSLEGEGTKAFRIPFQENATHQAIVLQATAGIKTCDSFVCLPGHTQSYVDHEVLAAATSGKPIIFLISERSGTLPNTADKRYPMFRLETTLRERFKPLIYFLRYVGADLKSTWQLCESALRHPLMFVWARVLLVAATSGLLVSWVSCLLDVITKGHNLTHTTPSYIEVTTPVVFANASILCLLASLAIASFTYSLLLCLGLSQRVRARRRARLKTVCAQFSRDEWIGVIPDLFPGGDLYESLFETVPLAHHEIEERLSS
jgi:hypothetical protein